MNIYQLLKSVKNNFGLYNTETIICFQLRVSLANNKQEKKNYAKEIEEQSN